MKSILTETQHDRDVELSEIIGMPIEEVQKLGIATPDSIRVSDGNKPDNLEDLYHDYEHLNFPAYLRTLMYTSVTRRHPELFKLLRETKSKVCLDFGSGVGSHAIALLENGNYVDLLDVVGKLQKFASDRLLHRGWYGICDVIPNDCNLTDDTYDIVICSDCLEHVNSPLAELKRMHKAIKKGGIIHLLVSTMRKPSSGHFDSSIDEWLKEGLPFMNANFEKVGKTLWKKK
jgi:ubiquinone/menaquinone biosynthesis C-methylase UbiE